MGKQYKKLAAVCIATLPLTFSSLDTAIAFNGYFDEIIDSIEIPCVYIEELGIENDQDGTSVRALTTSDIMDIIKKYKLINHPDYSAQIMLERLQIDYKDGLPVYATTKVGDSRIYKYSRNNYSISSIDMYTEYGVTDVDGYDTVVHLKFNGNKDTTDILSNVLNRVLLNTDELAQVLHSIGGNTELFKTFTFKDCRVDISKGIESGRGIQSVDLSVYENKNVHNGKILDTVRLQEIEHLSSQQAFNEMKNCNKENSNIFTKALDMDKNNLSKIKIERAWTNILNIESGVETDDFDVYYLEKSDHYEDSNGAYTVSVHLDNYDRFKVCREYFMNVSSTSSKEYLSDKAFRIFEGRDDLVYSDKFNTDGFKLFSISKYSK